MIAELDIQVDPAGSVTSAIGNGIEAAARFNLTAYDAFYVELAQRGGLTLATLDGKMRRAAELAAITTFN